MNLYCPNCQKMLTVPDQHAGQLMECPMCKQKFTAPNAPPPVASDPEPPKPPPPPEPATYGVVKEPEPAFSAPPPPPPSPAVPAFVTSAPAPKPEPPKNVTPAPKPSASPGDYTRAARVVVNEAILQWVPIGAVAVIFFLQFFPWVGVYPGGRHPAVTQSAWGAAFGGYTPDPDMDRLFVITTEETARSNKDKHTEQTLQEMLQKGVTLRKDVSNQPGVSLLTLFYLLFFLATLVFTIFVVVAENLKVQLPPQVDQAAKQLLPFKWTILAGLNAILVLFLGLQLLLNFSLETRMAEAVEATLRPKEGSEVRLKTDEQKQLDAIRGNLIGQVQRTFWLKLAFLLHLVAAAAAGLVYWMERRGPGKPAPYVELRW